MVHLSKKKLFGLASFLIVFLILSLITDLDQRILKTARAQRQGIIFNGDFEDGNLSGYYWHHNAPEVVTAPHPVRAGTYSMRSYLHRYESTHSIRTEVHVCDDDSAPANTCDNLNLGIGKEHWLGFSTYFPADYVVDKPGDGDELIFQIQAVPDPGEDWLSPIFAIYIIADEYVLISRWESGSATVWRHSWIPDRGKWTDWVIHVKLSYSSNGWMEIWYDGELVASRSGPNCFNDRQGPQIEFGIYKWPWGEGWAGPGNTDWRLLYHDEFRVGNASASYQDVAPGGVSSTPKPTPQVFISLSPGWNVTTWPNVSNYTAQTALNDIDTDCEAGTGLVIARKEQDFWEEYVAGYGGKNYDLQSNKNYSIKVSRACLWAPQ